MLLKTGHELNADGQLTNSTASHENIRSECLASTYLSINIFNSTLVKQQITKKSQNLLSCQTKREFNDSSCKLFYGK